MHLSMTDSGAMDHPFFGVVLDRLDAAGVPYLVGGAFGYARYTGIERDTKDLDIFVLPDDCTRVLEVCTEVADRTEVTFPHWLAKLYRADHLVDVIFSSGNGIARVDPAWFEHAVPATVLGRATRLVPVEEMIWSKGLIMERERYDGNDVAHLLRACAEDIDWSRLLFRFGPYWRVLLAHLVLFGFIYPAEQDRIPAAVMRELTHRLDREGKAQGPADRVCRGTLISRGQYQIDVENWGYLDGRTDHGGPMTPEDVAHWDSAFKKEHRHAG